ncbi:cyclic lactone autoinducer peptide [Blautia sp.]|jgi:cyclic lactone autoinducer peptide|uniref:cyclic lactone autoinducer peptide n=1 Tax=Blautia sp. TaxID=1955243 RepID=UPI002585D989|nr:cyclic lactone autoinducer peptide [Blautia sp.]
MKFIKSFIKNHSTQITSFALAMAVIITNMNCWGKAFQEKLPEEIDKLRKYK